MAEDTATACNARGDLSWTHIVLNYLYDYFTRRYNETQSHDMDQYVFSRAYRHYYGGEPCSTQAETLASWTADKPLPFFVTRVYDLLVEKGELPKQEVRSVSDVLAQ